MSESTQSLQQLALALFDIGAVRLGRFKLHSGKSSPLYLDLRLLASFPDVMRAAAVAYRQLLEKLDFDLLAATPLAGLPIGTAVSLEMNTPLIYPRKTAKTYGTGKSIEGKWSVGQSVVIIDDLITSGDSIIEAIVSLKSAGLQVKHAVVLIDRQQGGAETLAKQGYQLNAVMSLSRLLETLEEHERITTRQRVKVLGDLR